MKEYTRRFYHYCWQFQENSNRHRKCLKHRQWPQQQRQHHRQN